jgi:DMSO/TMAO reductase YedYZ heme-binding membrane subunit
MTLIITLVAVSVIVFACGGIIKRFPVVFYALALVLDVIYVYCRFYVAYNPLLFSALQIMQKGFIAFALFTMVMFIGAFDESSRLRRRLDPIRPELSILGCLFVLGHVVGYLASYLMTLFRDTGAIPPSVLPSLLVSLTCLVLLVVLGATTLVFVRSRMRPHIWKKIQQLSYAFYGLVFVHLLIMLIPSASRGRSETTISLVIYAIVFVGYVITRTRKTLRDRRRVAVLIHEKV